MTDAQFKVHTWRLLEEVMQNPGTSMLRQPMNIFMRILAQVAQRSVELQDDELTALMVRLALFEQADPYSPEFDAEMCAEALRLGAAAAKARA